MNRRIPTAGALLLASSSVFLAVYAHVGVGLIVALGAVLLALRAAPRHKEPVRSGSTLPIDGAAIVAASPDGLAVSDRGLIVTCNDRFAGIVGLAPKDVVGTDWEIVLGSETAADLGTERIVRSGTTYEITVTPLGPDRLLIHARDLTAEDKARAALASSVSEDVVDLLASRTVHDMRNALAGITMSLEGMEPPPQASQQEAIADALIATRVLAELIADLSLAWTGSSSPNPVSEFDPIEVVRAALRLARHKFDPSWTIEEHLGVAPMMQGRPSRLAQAVLNLLVNAAEACRPLPGPHHIAVTVREADGKIVIEVTDSGPGVPANLRERVVSTYFTTKGNDGTGLGLSIVRHVAAEFGGTLEIGDAPRGGALFRLVLKPNALGTLTAA